MKNQMHIIQRFHIIAVFCYHGVSSDIPYRYIFEWVYGKYYKLIQTEKSIRLSLLFHTLKNVLS